MVTACKLFFQGSPCSNRNFMVALPKTPEDYCININWEGGGLGLPDSFEILNPTGQRLMHGSFEVV